MSHKFTLLALLFVLLTTLQAQRCPGRPDFPICRGAMDQGNEGTGCEARAGQMWYYSRADGRCLPIFYRGCGGNFNRHCDQSECDLACSLERFRPF